MLSLLMHRSQLAAGAGSGPARSDVMDRLTANDLASVWTEDFGWFQYIGALAVLDGGGLVDPEGRFRVEAARQAIEERLHLVPRLRQVLYVPRRGLGPPLWVDAAAFDVADHVRVFPGAAPVDEAGLLLVTEQLRRRGWTGRGRCGRCGSCRACRAVGWACSSSSITPSPTVSRASPCSARCSTGTRTRIRRPDEPGCRRRCRPAAPCSPTTCAGGSRQSHRALARLARPVDTARKARAVWPALREVTARRAPRTSLNRPIGPDRRLAVIRGSLDLTRHVAHAHDATLNDVLLAAVAGGLRDLLRGRGERVDEMILQAMVPVSLHRRQPGLARGNLDGAMVVPLPVGVADPAERLRLIAADTAQRRKRTRPAGGTLFPSRLVQRAFLRLATRQRITNVYVANVPGPPAPLRFAGARCSRSSRWCRSWRT